MTAREQLLELKERIGRSIIGQGHIVERLIIALIHDPLQTELPSKGRWVVSEGDLQMELDIGDSKVRKAVTEMFPDRLKDLRDVLRTINVPVLPIHTSEGVAEQLRQLLGYVPRVR